MALTLEARTKCAEFTCFDRCSDTLPRTSRMFPAMEHILLKKS